MDRQYWGNQDQAEGPYPHVVTCHMSPLKTAAQTPYQSPLQGRAFATAQAAAQANDAKGAALVCFGPGFFSFHVERSATSYMSVALS
mmetsp:Transcript_8877/g.15382  ORF Transcript_8877/g.15382 Transcript_8877/m.15382 type:complete len:87 (-) Transcript_8877:946-1206(-)